MGLTKSKCFVRLLADYELLKNFYTMNKKSELTLVRLYLSRGSQLKRSDKITSMDEGVVLANNDVNCCGFYFGYQEYTLDKDGIRHDGELRRDNKTYLFGKKVTIDQLKAENDNGQYDNLIENMELIGDTVVVRIRNGHFQYFVEGETILL